MEFFFNKNIGTLLRNFSKQLFYKYLCATACVFLWVSVKVSANSGFPAKIPFKIKYTITREPKTQEVDWTYTRSSDNVQDIFWIFHVRSVYVLYLGSNLQTKIAFCYFEVNTVFWKKKLAIYIYICKQLVPFRKKPFTSNQFKSNWTNKKYLF